MLTRKSHKVTFVMYQDHKIARAFEFDKRKLKFIFLSISLMVLTGIISWALILYLISSTNAPHSFLQKKEEKNPKVTTIDDKADDKEQLHQLKQNQEEGQKKQELTSVFPSYFQTPLGYSDLTNQELIKLTNIDTNFEFNRISLSFNLVNNTKNGDRVSGYIFILMFNNSTISFYPQKVSLPENPLPSYRKGESFKILYFKQVQAQFNQSLNQGSKVIFKFYIFSMDGNLIYQENIGPLKVEQS